MRLLVAVLLTSVLSAPALAAGAKTSSSESSPLTKEAQKFYSDGDYESALRKIEEGLSLNDKDVELLLLRLNTYLKLERLKEALGACEDVLAANPKPGDKKIVKGICADLKKVSATTLTVEVTNGPAKVYLDTRSKPPLCTTPDCTQRTVRPARYKVIIDRDGFERLNETITISLGDNAVLTKTLKELPSPLAVSLSPAEAELLVDGVSLGKGATLKSTLSPGDHTLQIQAPGYAPETKTISAHEAKPVELRIALQKQLVITTSPKDAKLAVNDTPISLTDGIFTLPPEAKGLSLSASAPGYEAKSVPLPLDLPPGATFNVELRQLGGFISVSGAPDGASLLVDGDAKGTLPLAKPVEIPIGERVIEINTPGMLPFRQSTTVTANQQLKVSIEKLRPEGKKKATIVLAGAGGLALGAAGLGISAFLNERNFNERATQPGVTTARVDSAGNVVSDAQDCDRSVSFQDAELQRFRQRGCGASLTSDILLTSALLAGGAGAALYFIEGKGFSVGSIALRPRLTLDGFAFSGSF